METLSFYCIIISLLIGLLSTICFVILTALTLRLDTRKYNIPWTIAKIVAFISIILDIFFIIANKYNIF